VTSGEQRIITLVIYAGGGRKVLEALYGRGIRTASLQSARGSSVGDPIRRRGLPVQYEKDVVSVVVPVASADEVFHFLFDAGGVDRPHGGFLYMARLGRTTEYRLPAGG
jgi:hypothetical protein